MKKYSTIKVAKLLDITSDTLHRWIRENKIVAPAMQELGPFRVRLWTEADVARVRAYKVSHYWGKGGRTKRKKRKE